MEDIPEQLINKKMINTNHHWLSGSRNLGKNWAELRGKNISSTAAIRPGQSELSVGWFD